MSQKTHSRSALHAVFGTVAFASGALLALPAAAYQEAPQLAALVKEGKLPTVDKRLPEKPDVVKPVDKVGSYGGTLRSALRGNGDHNAILRLVGNQGLVRWNLDFQGVSPNLAESWTVSKDGSEFVFKLRKGLKWSDGSPFTADDILFSMNDVVGNKQFLSQVPSQYTADGKYAEITKIDDTTVKFKFAGSYRSFLEQLSTPLGQHPTLYSKNYCQQFHPKYNPKVQELVSAAKAQDWAALFRARCGDIEIVTRWGNPDKPTMDPWVIAEPYSGGATRVALRRNPYFWQVDTAGNQLPYIDNLQLPIISEVETIVLAAINGQLDFQVRHIDNIQNRPVLAENAAKGNYKVLSLPGTGATSIGVFLNQSTTNPKLRELMRNKEFRIALSEGMDRKEINDIVFLGQGEPWQIGPRKQHKYYNEKLAKQFTAYDPKDANARLDKMGLTQRDPQGFRQYKDGGRIAMNVIASLAYPSHIEALELMRKHWAKIGVELVIRASERTLFYDRANNNDYDISVDALAGGLDPTQNPRGFLAVHPQESRQSLLWVRWYESKGKTGEEPPASMKKRLDLYDQWKDAATDSEADSLFRQILAISADELEVLGTVAPPGITGVRSNKLINVYDRMPWSWVYPTPGPALPQTWAFTR
ncbi:ABC transporter substrate-binding protein [Uliginosibacterium sp. H1]|uniref:ABC transporter substrate-binding protein n=1 Tax=Uliginosibacterium sp. H1 TaxID=3114757 RepID=UPI002E18C336|nr:ABC transporter substrate-binding protein [Uliginosibacterium sp. H1]